MPKAIKEKMRKGVESAVTTCLSKRVCPSSSCDKDKTTFQNLIFDLMCELLSCTVPQDMFDALDQSFRRLVPKVQALETASLHLRRYPSDSVVGTGADQDADTLLSFKAAMLSLDHESLDRSDDKKSDNGREPSKQAAQSAIRLQGSIHSSPDESGNTSGEETGDGSKVEIKGENDDVAAAAVSQDPKVFTITLGIPIAANDHRFAIRFNDKRVVDGLSYMPSREIWQLVHDAIQQDSNISNHTTSLSRITEVQQLDDGCVAFRMGTEEDLETLSTHVQWARNIRDTISPGIKTYKVVFENVRIRAMKMNKHTERALIIDKIREENSEKIPSLNNLGAIRDVVMLQGEEHKKERDYLADYLLVFGSREAANAAVEAGLMYCRKSRKCVVYEPGARWYQQCSYCQRHSHTAKDCQSTPLCGKCGYKHERRYCTSAIIKCANCHGEHGASSKKCPHWLKAEEKAHRSYRFPTADSEPQTPTPAKPATVSPPLPPLPPPLSQDPQEMANKNAKLAPPPRTSPTPASNTHPAAIKAAREERLNDVPSPASQSALLQTIDELRAFVAGRENTPSSRKRKASEYVMTGALQEQDHDGKRVRRT